MKVLLTGSAGFIGGAIGRGLDEAGDEVVRVDLMLDQAHGSTTAPEGTHQVDVRDAATWTHLLAGVVKGIVEAHRGVVTVENVSPAGSRGHAGCRFLVTLPA